MNYMYFMKKLIAYISPLIRWLLQDQLEESVNRNKTKITCISAELFRNMLTLSYSLSPLIV